jgi:hypothetical protein
MRTVGHAEGPLEHRVVCDVDPDDAGEAGLLGALQQPGGERVVHDRHSRAAGPDMG